MSKIIQKEKERQELFLQFRTPLTTIACQKHSLINLKEYMEEELNFLNKIPIITEPENAKYFRKKYKKTEQDIKEITKMIKRGMNDARQLHL